MTKKAKPQALPRMTIVGTYKDSHGKTVECLLVRINRASGKQEAVWIEEVSNQPLEKQPAYENQLEAIDWFYHRFEEQEPSMHVE